MNYRNLTGADLRRANLSDADLYGCVGDRSRIKTLGCSGAYPICYTADRIQIGCRNHSTEEWRAFSDHEIDGMDRRALKFWKEFKDFILSTVERFPAK